MKRFRRSFAALVSCAVVAVMVGPARGAGASPNRSHTSTATPDVPYSLPVQLPSTKNSPAVTADAPYTPVVRNLIAQLEPTSVARDLVIRGTGVRVAGSTIHGDVDALGTRGADDQLSAGTNVVCNSTIGGDLNITASSHDSPWDIGQCGPNKVHGNVVFAGNQADGNSLEGNTIDRNLVCDRNRSIASSGNTVKGRVEGGCGR
jgi:hypothetical protein